MATTAGAGGRAGAGAGADSTAHSAGGGTSRTGASACADVDVDSSGSQAHAPRRPLDNPDCIDMPKKMDLVFGDWLYLGGALAANDKALLQSHSVARVCNCAADLKRRTFNKAFVYHHIHAFDDAHFNMVPFLAGAVRFIDAGRIAGENVLVHCRAGVSRSATVVIAYIMAYHGWSVDKCLAHVTQNRPRANPNPGFRAQLGSLARALRDAGGDCEVAFTALAEAAPDAQTGRAELLKDAAAVVVRFRRVGVTEGGIRSKLRKMGVTLQEVEEFVAAARAASATPTPAASNDTASNDIDAPALGTRVQEGAGGHHGSE